MLTGQSIVSILFLNPHSLLSSRSDIILCSDSIKTLDRMVHGSHVEGCMLVELSSYNHSGV